uniref:Uncharacterized protein n=1 Tax=Cacopsylla melanoneura TaxID=428564 RepID=A0A8D8T228_9HEMI
MAGDGDDGAAKAATEAELKVLQARKNQLFENIQKIYDAAKNPPTQVNTEFLKRHVATLDTMFGEFCRTTERVNILEVTLKPSVKINFSDVKSSTLKFFLTRIF